MEIAPRISSLIMGDGFKDLNSQRKFNVLDKQTEKANPVIEDQGSNRLAAAIRSMLPHRAPVNSVAPPVATTNIDVLPDVSPASPDVAQTSSWKIPRKALDYLEELGDSANPIIKKKLKALSFDIEDLTSVEEVMNKVAAADYVTDRERDHLRSIVNNVEFVDTASVAHEKGSKLSIEALRESYVSELLVYREMLRENRDKYAKVMAEFNPGTSTSPKTMSEIPKPEALIRAEQAYTAMKRKIKLSMVHGGKLSVGAMLNVTEKEREAIQNRMLETAAPIERGIIDKALRV